MHGSSLHGNRESPDISLNGNIKDRSGKVENHTPDMNVSGQSDSPILPKKQPNKAGLLDAAEVVEGRGLIKGNGSQKAAFRTQGREDASTGLRGVRKVARKDKRVRFTSLMHHITIDLLGESFYNLKRQASPGVDGMTWEEYEVGLDNRLKELHNRVHRGTFRAQPSKRTYIPKADGRKRPLGIASLEDKIVQQAVVTVLNEIYEEDFVNFSFGFRPGRSQHDALDALWVGLMMRKVNWVLDADIQGFFDTLDHKWMMKFLEHRIADRRILRLIRKWLRAGVSEDGQWSRSELGTPQGSVISPLLANIYLHYVLDLWIKQWRKKKVEGDVIFVRYADDSISGFQHRYEAERFLHELGERMQQFGLTLHPDKTRLIEFGRFAAENRQKHGEKKPETFDFLGFKHICGCKKLSNGFTVKRKTVGKRLRARLQQVKQELYKQMHYSIPQQGLMLRRIVQGYLNYHAIHGNMHALETFVREIRRYWFRILCRRSQHHHMNWEKFSPIVDRWIPKPKILHPYPNVRFFAKYPR
jgi:RNA-directed DNA polymerase